MVPKNLKERDNLDLLELVIELHYRAWNYPSKEMHDAYWDARTELQSRLKNQQKDVGKLDLDKISENIDKALESTTKEEFESFLKRDKEAIERLNEVWGDDKDWEYQKMQDERKQEALPEVEITSRTFEILIHRLLKDAHKNSFDPVRVVYEVWQLSEQYTRQIFEKVLPTKEWVSEKYPKQMSDLFPNKDYNQDERNGANALLDEIRNRLNNLK